MIKYADSLLEYKNSFRDVPETIKSTDSLFADKYFPGGSAGKKFNPPFIPGVIYSFLYRTDSKVSKDRTYIDRNPIILCIDSHPTKDLGLIVRGIDLVVVPPEYRVKILSKIHDTYYTKIEANEDYYESKGGMNPLPLSDKNLSALLTGTGYETALFGFKAKFMREIKVLDLDDWYKIPYLRKSMIEGLSLQGIYTEYQSKLI
jgi:hypothetical protein